MAEPLDTDDPPMDDDDVLLRRLKRLFVKDRAHFSDWFDQAKEDYAFVSGDQWDSKDIASLKEQLRPVITFNRIDPLIRSVSGEQINNAQEVRYIPREPGDARPNELLTSAAEWFRDQCDADDEESDAFWDAAVCGVGATDSRLDMDENPDEPMPAIERIDPLEVFPDKDARKRNYADRRRTWRVRKMALDGARAMFPEASDSDLDAGWARLDDTTDTIEDNDPLGRYDEPRGSEKNDDKLVTIVQVQWWDREPYYKVALPPGLAGMVEGVKEDGTLELKVDEYQSLKPKIEQLATDGKVNSLKLERRVYHQAFLGRTVLKQGKPAAENDFTIHFITGFRDRNAGHFYGLVRAMKDPQRWANKWLSQTLHIMNTTAKGGVVAERDIAEDEAEFKKSWAKSDEITWVRPGALREGAMQPKPQGQFPAGFYQLMQFAISSVRDVAGINLEMLGMREADQPASLEYQRRQAGITILAQLFRSFRRYHRTQGKVLLYYIQNHLSDNRLVRIIGEEGAQYVPLAKQADVKYDIVVDEGPSSPNQRERVWALIGDRFWTLPPEIQLTLLDYSPFPDSVIQKVKEAAQKVSEGPQAQMAQRMGELEAQLKEVDLQLETAKVAKTKAETLKIASSVGEDGKPDDGPQKAVAELQRDREALVVDLQKHRERLANDLQIAREKAATGLAGKGGGPVVMVNGQGGQPRQPNGQGGPPMQPQGMADGTGFALTQIAQALAALAQIQRQQADMVGQAMMGQAQQMTLMQRLMAAPTQLITDPETGRLIGSQKVLQ